MNEMSSAQLYRARTEAIARASEENQRLYDIMQAARARQRHVDGASQDHGRLSLMKRVRLALSNTFSRRRESHDTEGSGPRAKSLHRSERNLAGSANRRVGNARHQHTRWNRGK